MRSTILVAVSVALSVQAQSSLDQTFGQANSQLLSGDYFEAGQSIIKLRKQIATVRIPVDYAAVHEYLNRDIRVADAAGQLRTAATRHHDGDITGAVQALDIASFIATKLYMNASPQGRFRHAQAAVEASISHSGAAQPSALLRAAQEAFKADSTRMRSPMRIRSLKAAMVSPPPVTLSIMHTRSWA